MIIESLELQNFRNFTHKEIKFCDAINVIFGLNGYGKTNLLEAISFTCLSKSFRTHNDNDLILLGENGFNVRARVIFDKGIEKEIKLIFSLEQGKQIYIDHAKVKYIGELIGSFPIVILAPENDSITTGPPQERRRFINLFLSQIDKEYLRLIQEYLRIVRQRNRLLQNARESRFKFSEKIEPWNEELFTKSTTITQKRQTFLEQLEKSAGSIYEEITSQMEEFSIVYKPSFDLSWSEYKEFKKVLEKSLNMEIMRGVTLVGPHRDEILFLLNGNELRKFGSRGQHRCCLLALKFAEYDLLRSRRSETPIFLLDDVYSEIDEVREKGLNDYFMDLKQIFLTTHESNIQLSANSELAKKIRYFHIQDNSFARQEIVS